MSPPHRETDSPFGSLPLSISLSEPLEQVSSGRPRGGGEERMVAFPSHSSALYLLQGDTYPELQKNSAQVLDSGGGGTG